MLSALLIPLVAGLLVTQAGGPIDEPPVWHLDAARGYRIAVPSGWLTHERDDPANGHILTLLPPGSVGARAVSVAAMASPLESSANAVRDDKLALLAARPADFPLLEAFEGELAGRPAAGLRLETSDAGIEYHLEQRIVIEAGWLYMVQCHAPADEFDDTIAELSAVAAGFGFAPRSEAAQQKERLAALVARCGDEVDWAPDWATASERATADSKPVLVVAYFLGGFALSSTPRTTTFMDEDVVRLVNARFVPLWQTRRTGLELTRPDGSAYGMGPNTFGQALLVVDPQGRVLAETQAASNTDVVLPFLMGALARAPMWTGPAWDKDLAGLELAERLVDRGELDAAWPHAEGLQGLEAARLRARILRLRRQGSEALAELEAARVDHSGAGLGGLELERAELLLRLDRIPEARAILEERVAVEREPALLARGLVLRGMLRLAAGDTAAAEADWQRVTDEFQDTRWASLAAVVRASPALELGIAPDFGWPSEDKLEEVLFAVAPAPLARGRAKQAAEGALGWLLAAQRPDGSFPEPSEVAYPAALGANPFVDATTALAGRALLAARRAKLGPGPELEAAIAQVLAYLRVSLASRVEVPPVVAYMDYMTWSDGAMLQFLAELQLAGLATQAELDPLVAILLQDLAARQQANGGWSYYKKNDLAADDVPAQSISFTTAGASLALSSARDAGFEVPEGLSERSTRALEELRDERGVFGYFLYGSGVRPHPPIQVVEGEVGRGPACELALFRAGASDKKRLASSIELFFDHAPLFAAERGKALMHAGPQGQGCHYLLFDYGHAALAAAELPSSARRRARILDLVLDCRQVDGSFLDTPILGRSYGTAMALLSLVALD